MVYILHIETSGDNGFVAVSGDGKVLAQINSKDSQNYAATINMHIDEVLAKTGITIDQLSAIAVCGGPGSYTGLRIGLSTAKGLCYVWEKPLMLHGKLLLLSIGVYYKHLSQCDIYAAVLVARDKEYFISAYNNNLNSVIEPQHVFEPELIGMLQTIEGRKLVTGQAIPLSHFMPEVADIEFVANDIIDMEAWGKYALEQYNCNGFVNLAQAEPFYLKSVYTHKPNNIS